jgi:thioesterase domain-containing protein
MNAQPEGPYRLCGYCASGLVAFEVARMLIAAGKEVEMVGMIDPPTVNAHRSVQLLFSIVDRVRPVAGSLADHAIYWSFRLFSLFNKFWNLPSTRRWKFLAGELKRLFAISDNKLSSVQVASIQPGGGVSVAQQLEDERNPQYARAVFNYLPKTLDVKVIYFSVEYGVGAWRRISPDVEVIKLPGTHGDIDLATFVDQLRSRLQGQELPRASRGEVRHPN